MNPLPKQFPISCLALICLVVATVSSMAATWDVIDLGTLGGSWSEATAINSHGQVVGWSRQAAGSEHAFSWTPTGGMSDLGTLDAIDDLIGSRALYLTDSGQVIGSSGVYLAPLDLDTKRVFSWTVESGMVDIGVVPGMYHTFFEAANPRGQVVGYSSSDAFGWNFRGFSWTSEGGMFDLGAYFWPKDVNSNGVVVGYNYSTFVAFSWTPSGGMKSLNPLPGFPNSIASKVNDNGMVAGYSFSSSAGVLSSRACIWTPGSTVIAVGNLGGGYSEANFVAPDGTVLGRSLTFGGNQHAFAWTAAGGIVDIHPTGRNSCSQVRMMNRSGLAEINAWGTEMSRTFAWTAGGGMRELIYTNGSFSVSALGEAGHIVGVLSPRGVGNHAFFWTDADGIVELPTFGAVLSVQSVPNAVNSRGQMAGYARAANNELHAALWQQLSPQPILRLERSTVTPGTFELLISQLITNTTFTVERTVNYSDWESLGQHVATSSSQTVPIVPAPNVGYASYRIRIP